MRTPAAWIALGTATVVAGWLLGRLGLPSPYLFCALLAGLAVALRRPGRLQVPGGAFTAAQAVCGVVLGAYLQPSSLQAVADSWLPILLVSAATLGVSLAAGKAIARVSGLDEPTATLGMVAGGASGIVAMADELGADDRLVAFMQYARVLTIVLLTPVLAGVLFPGGAAVAPAGGDDDLVGTARNWAIALACAPAGALLGRGLRVPAATLLGPMILAGALTLSGVLGTFTVPPLLREAAFVGIGLEVGLRFTAATVRRTGRLLAPLILAIAGLVAACFGLALLLHLATSVTLEDAYLATTPGGLYAVLAVSFGAGADTTFILAVQTLRLVVMVLLAPFAVRRLTRRPATMQS